MLLPDGVDGSDHDDHNFGHGYHDDNLYLDEGAYIDCAVPLPDRRQPRLMVQVSVVQLLEKSSSVSSQLAFNSRSNQFWENTSTMQSKRNLF